MDAPRPSSSPTSNVASEGDVFADAVKELTVKMENEKREIQRVKEAGGAADSPTVAAQASAGSGEGTGAPPSAASSGRRESHDYTLSEDDVTRIATDKERVERQERQVRSKLDERLRQMQTEAARCVTFSITTILSRFCGLHRFLVCLASRLNSIRQELASMTEPARHDIQLIRFVVTVLFSD